MCSEGPDARIRAEEKRKMYVCVCLCVEDLHNPVDLCLFFTPSHQNGRDSERNDYSRPRECARHRYLACLINQLNETKFF